MSLLVCGPLIMWSQDRWALAVVQIGIFGLAVAAAWEYAILRRPWLYVRLQWALLAIPAWGCLQISLDRSVYRFDTWTAVLLWLTLAFAFGIACQLFADPNAVRRLQTVATFCGALLALWAILQEVSGQGKILGIYASPDSDRPMGPFLNADHFAAFMELLLPIPLWNAFRDRQRQVLLSGVSALIYASIIVSASRVGSILVNVEVAAVVCLAMRSAERVGRPAARRVLIQIGILILAFSSVAGWDLLIERMQHRDPFAGRREIWQGALAMIQARPIAGFGLGTWTTAYPGFAVFDARTVVNAAHNDWLQWAADGGVPFGLLMAAVAARSFQLGIRMPWGLGAATLFTHALADFPLQKQTILLWLVIVIAALETESMRRRPRKA